MYESTPFAWVLTIAVPFELVLAAVAWRRRPSPGAGYLALLELAVAQWTFAGIFEVATTEVSLKLLWSQISYLGVTFSPVCFFGFAVSYAQQKPYLSWQRLLLLSLVPLLTIGMAWTNQWHHWVWTEVSLGDNPHMASYQHGPWFWVHIGYSYLLCLGSFVLLLHSISRFPGMYRRQLVALLLGSIIPLAMNLIYVMGWSPLSGWDWTPLAFMFSGAMLVWGMLWHRLLDLQPMARNQLVDTMGDGLLVIDALGRLADMNPSLERALDVGCQDVLGQRIETALEHVPPLVRCVQAQFTKDTAETPVEIALPTADPPRVYDLRTERLEDSRRQFRGILVIMRDVTVRVQMEQEREALIHELKRALKEVKTLKGLLPICSNCKRIRDEGGDWWGVERYVQAHSSAKFSHGLCPECLHKLYPDFAQDVLAKL